MLFFARRCPLPSESDFFWRSSNVASGLHNDSFFPDYVKHAFSLGGFAILVRMISMVALHRGQVIFARSLIFFSILNGLTRRTICRNLMSFLLHGWRKP